jgi:hypothetical protein
MFESRSLAIVTLALAIYPASAYTQTIQPPVDAAERRAAESSNVRVEVVLTDRIDAKTSTEERVEMVANERLTFLLADRHLGRLRRNLPGNNPAFNRNFEVDVTPTVFGSRIRLALTVNYQTVRDSAAGRTETQGIAETVQFVETATLFVESGKPTLVIDATGDPASRRVSVQATATIVK